VKRDGNRSNEFYVILACELAEGADQFQEGRQVFRTEPEDFNRIEFASKVEKQEKQGKGAQVGRLQPADAPLRKKPTCPSVERPGEVGVLTFSSAGA
jgi:hypothetical protein